MALSGASAPCGPQVILLGVDSPIGLAMTRELARHGVRVHAMGGSGQSLGLHSRYVVSRHLCRERGEPLLGQIREIAAATGCYWIMTVSEDDIVFLQEQRERLAPVVPLVPSAAAMARVLDKSATLRTAREVGIAIPTTWSWPDLAAMERDLPELTFPLVLKWANPARVYQRLAAADLICEKSRYVYDADALRRYLENFAAIGELPLAQRYCPGYGLGQMVYMYDGEALLRFQHRRLAEWPPEGGASAVCESLSLAEHPALFEQSVELLRRLGFNGPAMVEYRFDPQTGTAVLMEINGRFWGSLPLAYHAGAPFAWTSYAVGALGETRVAQPDYRVGLRCRYFVPELKRLLRITFDPGATQDRGMEFDVIREWAGFLAAYVQPRSRYFVFELADPLPMLSDLWFMLIRALR